MHDRQVAAEATPGDLEQVLTLRRDELPAGQLTEFARGTGAVETGDISIEDVWESQPRD
jgi:hypothetical protein